MKRKFRKSLSYAGELSSTGRAHGEGASSSSSATSLCRPEEDEPFWEEEEGTVELVLLGANRTKNILILMSDTGGCHRASAEAIKDTFRIEFGDEFQIKKDKITKLVVLPLYPQYSISTSGSSICVLQNIVKEDSYFCWLANFHY